MKQCVDPERGVALLMVLWIVAALSIMITGVQHTVRGEARIAGQSRRAVVANGLADAAIRVVLQELSAEKSKPIQVVQVRNVVLWGNEIRVEVSPLNGRIDLNSAPASLLADAFQYSGGVSADEAQRLARAVIEKREFKAPSGLFTKFQSVEDLLTVSGASYPLYAKLAPLLTVDIIGSGRVNPMAAAVDVLAVLTKGDYVRAQQLIEARHSHPDFMDTTSLATSHVETASSSYLAIRATVLDPDRAPYVRTWRVDVSSAAYGLPWRLLGLDQGIALVRAATAQ